MSGKSSLKKLETEAILKMLQIVMQHKKDFKKREGTDTYIHITLKVRAETDGH